MYLFWFGLMFIGSNMVIFNCDNFISNFCDCLIVCYDNDSFIKIFRSIVK